MAFRGCEWIRARLGRCVKEVFGASNSFHGNDCSSDNGHIFDDEYDADDKFNNHGDKFDKHDDDHDDNCEHDDDIDLFDNDNDDDHDDNGEHNDTATHDHDDDNDTGCVLGRDWHAWFVFGRYRVVRCGPERERCGCRRVRWRLGNFSGVLPLKVSAAIAALNEGPDLEVTVSMLLGGRRPVDEVIVVDDCSLEPIAPRLASWKAVRVIRNDRRLGSGPSKHLAAERCNGDAVVVCDSHMRVGYDWLDILLRDHAANPSAVLCPANRGFEYDGAFYGAGAKFVLEEEGFWKPSWLSPRKTADAYTVPCIIGGLYFLPRHILDTIGGYSPGLAGYGCEEEWVSLRVLAAGFECRVSPKCIALHHYGHSCDRRSACGSDERPWEMARNRIFIRDKCFHGSKYEIPIASQHEGAVSASLLAAGHFQIKWIRSPGEVARLAGIEHPTGG